MASGANLALYVQLRRFLRVRDHAPCTVHGRAKSSRGQVDDRPAVSCKPPSFKLSETSPLSLTLPIDIKDMTEDTCTCMFVYVKAKVFLNWSVSV